MPDNKNKNNKPNKPDYTSIIDKYIANTRHAESGNDLNAKNPNSTATGLYQFTKSTWSDMEKALGKKLDIFSPKDQESAMREYTKRNAETLEKNGLEVTPANLYTTHVLGKSGGPKFLKALLSNPNESASKYASDSAVNANRNLFFNQDNPVSAAELYNTLSDKVNPQSEQSLPVQQQNIPQQEFNETQIDNTATEQPRIDPGMQMRRSKPLSGIEQKQTPETINNPVEERRMSLGLTGSLDFLPKDINLAFGEDEAVSEEEEDGLNNMARDGGDIGDPKKNKTPEQLNKEAYEKSLLQAKKESAKDYVEKNMREVSDSFLWNLPGNVYAGIPKYGINLGKGALNALKHQAKMLGIAQSDNLITEGVDQLKKYNKENQNKHKDGGNLDQEDPKKKKIYGETVRDNIPNFKFKDKNLKESKKAFEDSKELDEIGRLEKPRSAMYSDVNRKNFPNKKTKEFFDSIKSWSGDGRMYNKLLDIQNAVGNPKIDMHGDTRSHYNFVTNEMTLKKRSEGLEDMVIDSYLAEASHSYQDVRDPIASELLKYTIKDFPDKLRKKESEYKRKNNVEHEAHSNIQAKLGNYLDKRGEKLNLNSNKQYEYGGNMDNKQNKKHNSEGLLNEFNEGDSHENNSYGGIPQGTGSNGRLNTVEEGETKFNNYVFSDTLKISDADVESLFLPKQIANKTFAEASKYINDFLKDNPNDKILKKTIQKQLDSLTLGNEKARLDKEKLDSNLNLNQDSTLGQDLELSNQMFLGGLENDPDNKTWNGIDDNSVEGLQKGADTSGSVTGGAMGNVNGGLLTSAMGTIGSAIGGIGDGLSAMGKKDPYYDPVEGQWDATEDAVGSTKDAVASAIGPWGALFRGVEKLGNGAGDAIGGAGGNYVKYAFSPDEAIMKNNMDPDVSTGDKLLGTVLPFHAAKTSRKAAQKRQDVLSQAHARRLNSSFDDKYELGGFINSYKNGGNKTNGIDEDEENDDLINKYSNKRKALELEQSNYFDYIPGDANLDGNIDAKDQIADINKKTNTYTPKQKNYMQYAPVLGDFMNMIDANRATPEVENLSRTTKRYQPEYTDEAYLQNISNNTFDNTINSLSNASGGSGAALRANILGANISRASNLSDAYFKANEANKQQNQFAQQFDNQNNQFNIGQSNRELEINAQNRAVVEDRRNLTRDAFYKDLGSLGRESTYNNRLQNLTGGYDAQGNYDPNNKSLAEQIADLLGQDEKKQNQNRTGGLLDLYNMKENTLKKKIETTFNNRYK